MADQSLQPNQDTSTAMLQAAMNQPVFSNVRMPAMPMADLQAMYGMMSKDLNANAGQQLSGGLQNQMALYQAQQKQQQAANQLQNSLMMAKLFPASQMNQQGMQQNANTLMGGQNPLLQGLGFPAGQGQAPTMPSGSMGQAQAKGTLDMLKTFMQPGAISPTTTSQDPSSVDPATGGMSQADASYYAGVPRRPGSMTDYQQSLQNKSLGNALNTIDTGLIAGPNGPAPAKNRAEMEWYLSATGKNTADPKIQAKLDQKYGKSGDDTTQSSAAAKFKGATSQFITQGTPSKFDPNKIKAIIAGLEAEGRSDEIAGLMSDQGIDPSEYGYGDSSQKKAQ